MEHLGESEPLAVAAAFKAKVGAEQVLFASEDRAALRAARSHAFGQLHAVGTEDLIGAAVHNEDLSCNEAVRLIEALIETHGRQGVRRVDRTSLCGAYA